jgi:hypothetical protein
MSRNRIIRQSLEHIPDTLAALHEIVHVARRLGVSNLWDSLTLAHGRLEYGRFMRVCFVTSVS